MTDRPITDCGRCGQRAYVGPYGIACYCTPGRSAEEHHTDDIRDRTRNPLIRDIAVRLVRGG